MIWNFRWKAKAVADFDGDGKADILWQDTTSGDVAIWMMDGTSIVGGGLVVGGMLNWHVLAVADYNGDGRSDVLWQNTGDGGVFVWFMDGTTITSGSGYVVNGMPSEWQAK
ncbi:MAG: VCBS repeat-containing protein [Magnetococcales bacterium]|nr:VCBS repeat-containing protein [Nitrospirota bacterium]